MAEDRSKIDMKDTTPPRPMTPARAKNLLIAFLALILFIGFVIVLFLPERTIENKNPQPTAQVTKTANVRITEDGFDPETLKITTGTTVVWTNVDTDPHQVAANPYPTHKSLPELYSVNSIDTNGVYRYTFTKPGTVKYHDGLNPEVNGTIIVE